MKRPDLQRVQRGSAAGNRLLSALFMAVLCGPLPASPPVNPSHFHIPIPGGPLGGASPVVLTGPGIGQEVLHTTLDLTYSSPHGGTPAASVVLELTVALETGPATLVVTGADLGWPLANGVFSGSFGSDALNGVLAAPSGDLAMPELVIHNGLDGVNGEFINSFITFELPGICQTDLGFGGPGSVQLAICGDLLSKGQVAGFSLSGAPPFAPMLLTAGVTFGPTPFKGGILVPVPRVLAVFVVADATGGVAFDVTGSGGVPLTVYLQAVVADPAQPAGMALSNALAVELLP